MMIQLKCPYMSIYGDETLKGPQIKIYGGDNLKGPKIKMCCSESTEMLIDENL